MKLIQGFESTYSLELFNEESKQEALLELLISEAIKTSEIVNNIMSVS